jgi:hypothetical protein
MGERCQSCQSERLEEARLVSAGIVPERAGLVAKIQAPAEVSVRVCLDCGAVDRLRADAAKLRKMVGES